MVQLDASEALQMFEDLGRRRAASDSGHLDLADPSVGAMVGQLVDYLGFPDRDTYQFRWVDASGSWRPHSLLDPALERAERGSAEEVLAKLKAACEQNSAEATQVWALSGINPASPVELVDGILLCALDDVAPSTPRDLLLGRDAQSWPTHLHAGFAARARATAALINTSTVVPLVTDTSAPEFDPSEHLSRFKEMKAITRCLTLLAPKAVWEVAHWAQPVRDHPMVTDFGVATARLAGDSCPPHEIDADLAHDLVEGYLAMSPNPALDLALERLNSAKEGRGLENRAIDLGTALEALLFQQSAPSEISWKFKARGALLASSDPQERRVAAQELHDLYWLRSKAAHGEAFAHAGGGRAKNARDHLDKALTRATQIIQRALLLKWVPSSDDEWDGLLLGWEEFPPHY